MAAINALVAMKRLTANVENVVAHLADINKADDAKAVRRALGQIGNRLQAALRSVEQLLPAADVDAEKA